MAKKIFYKPADAAVAYTEVEIAELEKKLIAVYSEAEADIQKKMDDFTAKYQKQDLIYQKQLKEGLITQADYDDWKKGRVFVGKQWAAKKDEIAAVLHNSNKISTSMINMSAFDVFGENSNYMAYTMEHTAGVNFGFQVYNTDAVAQLIKDDPELLPKWKVDQKKDYDWNRKNLNNAITQGIIQGESLSKISKRVSSSLAGKNENLMNTFAKTGMTQAQNSGRLERMEKGKALGIDVKKKWVATLDGRTRYAHRELDGQIVDTDEDFKTEGYTIAYPGDPQAHPSLVYNCRCAITSSFDKYPSKYQRYDNIDGVPIDGMTYREWEEAKTKSKSVKPATVKKSTIVDGKDISSTWKRRLDEFNFEIEDVINAQGFDGKPRVVSAEEFDKYVQEANDGKGFIAQRTYSAPNQETLDVYRDQLYNGKWYVDCSTGGAQYGQGMYCAADYTGTLNQGISAEMEHYQNLNISKCLESISEQDKNRILELRDELQKIDPDKYGDPYKRFVMNNSSLIKEKLDIDVPNAYTETLTLDKSAKVITYEELEQKINNLGKAMIDGVPVEKWKANELMKNQEAFKAGKITAEEGMRLDEEINKKALKAEEEAFKLREEYQHMDRGSVAALWGYDAINAEGHGESASYTVILNRTKLIIKGE